ncbi:hypothetical protein ACLB2K_016241 [Fragaria x ananassa]
MLSLAKRLKTLPWCLEAAGSQLRGIRTEARSPRRRSRSPAMAMRKAEEKSEWWIVDGEMHEIGDHVPPRERFVIPRDNIPNKRRKQLREQFMRRTRLVLKETEHEPWCKKYMELYQELRENWERLYWDEGYSKKLAQDHANYESAEDDDQDFSPYRSKQSHFDQFKELGWRLEIFSASIKVRYERASQNHKDLLEFLGGYCEQGYSLPCYALLCKHIKYLAANICCYGSSLLGRNWRMRGAGVRRHVFCVKGLNIGHLYVHRTMALGVGKAIHGKRLTKLRINLSMTGKGG